MKQVNYFIRGFEVISERVVNQLIPLTIEATMAIIVLWVLDVRLGILAAAWLVLFLFVSWFISLYRYQYVILRSAAESKATGILADTITNNANVKLFCGYDAERQLYREAIGDTRRLRLITWRLNVLFDGVQGFLTTALEAGMLVLAFYLWRRGILTVGDFVLIQTYLFRIFNRVWDFGGVIRDIYESFGDAEDMTKILTAIHTKLLMHLAPKLWPSPWKH